MERELELDEKLNVSSFNLNESSTIFRVLTTRLNYAESRMVSQYSSWKKF